MTRMLFVAIVLVLGLTGTAQIRQEVSDAPPVLSVSARTTEQVGGLVRMSGNVTITVAGAVVTADEATSNPVTNDIELRGNVRMKLTHDSAK